MKLWDKGIQVSKEIDSFTAGADRILDDQLVKYDCIASIAHVKMLAKCDIISQTEADKLIHALSGIPDRHSKGEFIISTDDEDCHSAIEKDLINQLGEVGKKVHTARSRNDQVLVALRLYERDSLDSILILLSTLVEALNRQIKNWGDVPIPGYTHMRKAMPASIKMWLGSYVDSLSDDIQVIKSSKALINQCPLGTAAGFGVPVFPIDRQFTSDELDFERIQENPMYAQLSRGKFEGNIISSLCGTQFSIQKLAGDLILFSMSEFGYVSLPEELCTGSSIMPQKKNPDGLELIRAHYYDILSNQTQVMGIIGNLMSGYHRDLQLTKKSIINSIQNTMQVIRIMTLIISKLIVHPERCKEAMTPELFATEEAYKLVKGGMAFRDAYQEIGKRFS